MEDSLGSKRRADSELQSGASKKCTYCEQEFGSRNKLFKHLHQCVVKRRAEAPSLREVEDVVSDIDSKDVYLYVVGGRHRGKTLGCTERFSFRKMKWEKCEPMLANRGSHGCAACDGYVYSIGGGGFKSNLSTCERCDVSTGKWEEIKAMNICCHALTVSRSDTDIYALGGWVSGSENTSNCEKLETSTGEWRVLSPMNLPRRMAGACVHADGTVLVFGGLCSNGNHLSTNVEANGWYTSRAERYVPEQDTWYEIKKLPIKGQASAAAVGEDVFIFIHGHQVFRYSLKDDNYINLGPLPEKEWYSFDVTTFGRRIFLCGGTIQGDWSTVLYSFDSYSASFEKLPEMTAPRRRAAICAVEI